MTDRVILAVTPPTLTALGYVMRGKGTRLGDDGNRFPRKGFSKRGSL